MDQKIREKTDTAKALVDREMQVHDSISNSPSPLSDLKLQGKDDKLRTNIETLGDIIFGLSPPYPKFIEEYTIKVGLPRSKFYTFENETDSLCTCANMLYDIASERPSLEPIVIEKLSWALENPHPELNLAGVMYLAGIGMATSNQDVYERVNHLLEDVVLNKSRYDAYVCEKAYESLKELKNEFLEVLEELAKKPVSSNFDRLASFRARPLIVPSQNKYTKDGKDNKDTGGYSVASINSSMFNSNSSSSSSSTSTTSQSVGSMSSINSETGDSLSSSSNGGRSPSPVNRDRE